MALTWLQRWRLTSVTDADRVRARRARRRLWLLAVAACALSVAYHRRGDVLSGAADDHQLTKLAFVAATVALGFGLAGNAVRALRPRLRSTLEPGSAGAADFLIRLVCLAASIVVALRIAGVDARAVASAAAVTAVLVGLAAQQTMGNLLAGLILFSARPYRVGDAIRLQAGPLAGQIEGEVISYGLMYTILEKDGDQTLIPNSTLLACAITPLRSPSSVDFTAKLRPGVLPTQVQSLLESGVTVALLEPPAVDLEALEDQVVVRITATPLADADGPQLADEVLRAVRRVTLADDELATEEFQVIVGAVAEEAEERADGPEPMHGLS